MNTHAYEDAYAKLLAPQAVKDMEANPHLKHQVVFERKTQDAGREIIPRMAKGQVAEHNIEIMRFLAFNGPAQAGTIADALGRERYTISVAMGRMRQMKYLRQGHRKGFTHHFHQITPKGRAYLAEQEGAA